jgi:DNA-binding response OmpR family regulator
MQQRVLLLDDHPAFRDSVAWFLPQERYDVHAVGDGDEAANLLRRSYFDLVIADQDHPGLSGERIAELSERCVVPTCSLQEDGVHKCVPIKDLLWHVQQVLTS